MNEVVDLSELCRLCLDSSSSLFSFDTPIHFSTKTIPELIKYCVDVDSNMNDGGISPKSVCQACLDKLQTIHEFKWKCHENDKYIKQIISHSGEDDITPYSPPPADDSFAYDQNADDEEDLLQPMEPMHYNYKQPHAVGRPPKLTPRLPKPKSSLRTYPVSERVSIGGVELKKGMRHGMFVCEFCNKSFKYVKPYKNHIKSHKGSAAKPMSYYKKRKQLLQAIIGEPVRASLVTQPLAASLSKVQKYKAEPQAAYDSISPYNSPPPYEQESVALHSNTRDSSPDFGEFMLNTSRQLLNGADDLVDDEEDLLVEKSASKARNAKKSNDETDGDYNPNGRARTKTRVVSGPRRLTPDAPERRRPRSTMEDTAVTAAVVTPPAKRPGPLSKTRGRPRSVRQSVDNGEDDEGAVQIEGVSEVDITKLLKAKRDSDRDFGEESTSQPSHSNRSRSRSSSVELIPEFDIFGR